MAIQNRPAALVFALACLAAGCITVTEPASPVRQGDPVVDIPGVRYLVAIPSALHQVFLRVEVDRLPRDVQELQISFGQQGGAEDYEIGYSGEKPLHTLIFEGERFEAGEYKYPAHPNAVLIVLRERQGNFTFNFRGRRFTIEHEGIWKPAILYYEEKETRELIDSRASSTRRQGKKSGHRRTITRTILEEVKAGPLHFMYFPEENIFEIAGREFTLASGETFAVDRLGKPRS